MTAFLKSTLFRRLMLLPPVAVGVVVLVVATRGRDAPTQTPPTETTTMVRVMAAPAVTVVPRALGYGNVEPGTVWEAVAEVGGKIVSVHPQYKRGAILPGGAELLRIDPTDYELAVAQIEASVRSVQAQLAELAVREENARASLAIEERALTLSRKDLERKRALVARKNVSQAAVDEAERSVLAGQMNVQAQRNTLNLIPAERQTLEAQLALDRARLADARLDLERTVVTTPFDGRIAEVRVERAQYATPGQVLAVFDSIDVSEVAAQIPLDKLMNIIAPTDTGPIDPASVMGELERLLGLSPIVRLHAGDLTVEWPARVARFNDTIDPQTRTVGVIAAVDEAYKQARPGIRPPLAKNMYVEVEFRGRPRPGVVVVPRSALHGRHVYVVGADSRLKKRVVTPLFLQTNFAAIESGLEPGERVVISDLIPAIEGMLLDPVDDAEAARSLVAEAHGEGPVR